MQPGQDVETPIPLALGLHCYRSGAMGDDVWQQAPGRGATPKLACYPRRPRFKKCPYHMISCCQKKDFIHMCHSSKYVYINDMRVKIIGLLKG